MPVEPCMIMLIFVMETKYHKANLYISITTECSRWVISFYQSKSLSQ